MLCFRKRIFFDSFISHFLPGIVFEKSSCLASKKAKLIAVLFGFAVAGCIVGGLYIGGVFSDAPSFADNIEGMHLFPYTNFL